MANALDLALATQQVGIGKGRVGEPPTQPGKKGITIAVALFFDGTLNNRSNTNKRIATRDTIIDDAEKDGRSSYGGFYSNVAVMESGLTQSPPPPRCASPPSPLSEKERGN